MIPRGFLFSAVEANIKKPGRKDLALIFSESVANVAGVFTTNRIKAAPIILNMKRIRSNKGQAILVNSGNANACNGKRGIMDAMEMSNHVAKYLDIKPSLVYVSSTGVIGTPMPMERIRLKIPELVKRLGGSTVEEVAEAIMTTDKFSKVVKKGIKIKDKDCAIVGICKGAGMICPKMATMLCFIITDVNVDGDILDRELRMAVDNSFNKITVDGDMSTNDMVMIMANGRAENDIINKGSKYLSDFREVLLDVTYELSKMIVRDGEGATKVIEVEVRNAKTKNDAEKCAFAVANSNLVKTAIHGGDSNWGRIMSALGYSGANVNENEIDIMMGDILIVKNGVGIGNDEKANIYLKNKEIKLIIDLHKGSHSTRVLTCDLSEEYIRINASYRS
jgi:glutamate N-acetyltransferase/amino-acid N-acetyltransferase